MIDDLVLDVTVFREVHPGGTHMFDKFAGKQCGWQVSERERAGGEMLLGCMRRELVMALERADRTRSSAASTRPAHWISGAACWLLDAPHRSQTNTRTAVTPECSELGPEIALPTVVPLISRCIHHNACLSSWTMIYLVALAAVREVLQVMVRVGIPRVPV